MDDERVGVMCILCSRDLERHNGSQVCNECRLIVADLLAVEIPEQWATIDVAGTDGVLVSSLGRVAKILPIDRSGHYPRVSIAGRRFYLHTLIARGFYGDRPDGALVLHGDDDPANATAGNLRYGDHAQNAADRRRNRRKEHHA